MGTSGDATTTEEPPSPSPSSASEKQRTADATVVDAAGRKEAKGVTTSILVDRLKALAELWEVGGCVRVFDRDVSSVCGR